MLTVTNPATGKVIRKFPVGTTESISDVMERSRQAYTAWKDTRFRERAEVLRNVAAYIREHVESLAPLMTEEMGKPIREARVRNLRVMDEALQWHRNNRLVE